MKLQDYIIVIVSIFLIMLWFNKCGPGHNDAQGGDTLMSTITYKFDTTIHHVESVNIYHHSSDTIYLPVKVDTEQVIKDYYTKYAYNDTISDTNIVATITDTLFKNSIFHRSFDYRLLRPTQIISTVIVAPTSPHFFLEGITGVNVDRVTQLSLKIDFISKKNQLFTAGWDFKNHAVIAGAGLRLK